MGIADLGAALREGKRAAADKLRSKGIAAAGPASASVDYSQYEQPTYQRQSAQYGQGKAFEFDPTKHHVGADGALRPNAAIDPTRPMTPPQNMASRAAPTGATTGMSRAGKVLGGIGSALYGVDAVDSALKGDTGNAVGSAGMAAAPFAGPVGLGAMAVDGVSRAATGKSLTDWIGTGVAKAFGPGESSMLTPEFQKTVAAAGGADKYSASLRSPVAAPGTMAASAAAPMTPPNPTIQTFEPGTAEARTIRGQVAGTGVPASGTGLIVNNSTGRAIRINAPTPEPEVAKPAIDPVEAELMRRIGGSGTNLRGQREALGILADYKSKQADLGLRSQIAARETTKFNTELGDKRMKDFSEQFVNNQFYTKDEDGKQTVDAEKNARFLDFMRQTDPRFSTTEGMAEIWKLSPQDRSKLVNEFRRAFVEKENVEQASNDAALFSKPGYSNQPISIRGPAREAVVGDIPDIGIKNYIRSNLPFTNRDVIDTDRGAVLAEDYIGTGEDSRGRRSKLYPKDK